MIPARYVIPGDVVLALAASLGHAFDGLKLAALAAKEGNHDALVVALQWTHTKLDLLHESLLAVVAEQPPEETHGTARPC